MMNGAGSDLSPPASRLPPTPPLSIPPHCCAHTLLTRASPSTARSAGPTTMARAGRSAAATRALAANGAGWKRRAEEEEGGAGAGCPAGRGGAAGRYIATCTHCGQWCADRTGRPRAMREMRRGASARGSRTRHSSTPPFSCRRPSSPGLSPKKPHVPRHHLRLLRLRHGPPGQAGPSGVGGPRPAVGQLGECTHWPPASAAARRVPSLSRRF